MTTELTRNEQEQQKMKMVRQSGGGGDAVYGIGLFGAWAYYLGQATTSQERVLGFFKGFVWPAMLVYELLTFLNKGTEIAAITIASPGGETD
jgi:hypothetical protein